jgi:hypothetical protein
MEPCAHLALFAQKPWNGSLRGFGIGRKNLTHINPHRSKQVMSDIKGNEYVMNISQSTWEERGDYWLELAENRARATKQEVVILVDDDVKYRSNAQESELNHASQTTYDNYRRPTNVALNRATRNQHWKRSAPAFIDCGLLRSARRSTINTTGKSCLFRYKGLPV